MGKMKQIFMEQREKEEMSKTSADDFFNDDEYWAEQAMWQELYEKQERELMAKEMEELLKKENDKKAS
jgi:hypothetical protein